MTISSGRTQAAAPAAPTTAIAALAPAGEAQPVPGVVANGEAAMRLPPAPAPRRPTAVISGGLLLRHAAWSNIRPDGIIRSEDLRS